LLPFPPKAQPEAKTVYRLGKVAERRHKKTDFGRSRTIGSAGEATLRGRAEGYTIQAEGNKIPAGSLFSSKKNQVSQKTVAVAK
jgi:hypothetical protein